ncbi:MAG: hypothetical protein AAEI92_09080 [Arenicellales bacterium]
MPRLSGDIPARVTILPDRGSQSALWGSFASPDSSGSSIGSAVDFAERNPIFITDFVFLRPS